jgi:signal peptidase I
MKRESQWGPALVERFYDFMLYAYPKAFRSRFRGEMRQAFRDGWRDAFRADGYKPRMLFFFALLHDWILSSTKERMVSMRIEIDRRWSRRKALRLTAALGTILACFLVSTTFLQAYIVPGSSMENGLRQGDHVLVKRVGLRGSINRGDVITFQYPADRSVVLVKRVIGLPGDRIRLLDKQVIRNGVRLVEPYAQHRMPFIDPIRDNFPTPVSGATMPRVYDLLANNIISGELAVPQDMLFVLGDNRDNSIDSRFWGLLPREDVIGKAIFVYWKSNSRLH